MTGSVERRDTLSGAERDVLDLPAYVPPPYVLPPALSERALALIGVFMKTRVSGALAVVDAVALFSTALSLRTAIIRTADAEGPLLVHCGVWSYLFGNRNHVVGEACRYAYAGHATVLFVAGSVAVLASIALAASISSSRKPGGLIDRVRRHLLAQVGSSPTRVAVASLMTCAVVVGYSAALVPAIGHGMDAAGQFVVRCGIDSYALGNPNPAVGRACGEAFAGHARLIGVCVLIAVGCLFSLARRVGDQAEPSTSQVVPSNTPGQQARSAGRNGQPRVPKGSSRKTKESAASTTPQVQ